MLISTQIFIGRVKIKYKDLGLAPASNHKLMECGGGQFL